MPWQFCPRPSALRFGTHSEQGTCGRVIPAHFGISFALCHTFDLPLAGVRCSPASQNVPTTPSPFGCGPGVQDVARSKSKSDTPTNTVKRSKQHCAGRGLALPCQTDRASSKRICAGFHSGNTATTQSGSSRWHASRYAPATRRDGSVVPVCLPYRMGTARRGGRCLGTALRGAKFQSEYARSRPGAADRFPSFRRRRAEYAS